MSVFRLITVRLALLFLILAIGGVKLNDYVQQRRREHIFALIAKGTLKANRDGVVRLPIYLASPVSGRSAYVLRKKGFLSIFLPTWFGKGSNVYGYLLTNRPLASSEIFYSQDMGSNAVQVVTPCWINATTRGVGILEVAIVEKLNDRTYFVYNGLS